MKRGKRYQEAVKLVDRTKEYDAKEALEILAPIAHHLGIHKIKSELEDLALRYLKPDVFYDIAEKLNKTKLERDRTVVDMQKEVSDLLTEHHITHEIKGRAKCIYSIYNKLNKGKKFSDIYDLLALRILVHTEQECYLALGIIHSKFRPLPKRFKDYIAMPKPNMYQSLHTTVFGVDGYLFEIQIRTYEMDEVAENGIASHWAYKENKGSNKTANLQSTTEQKLQFFKSIIDLSHDKMSSEEFVNSVKDEVLNNNIYCFTPKGDVIELPKGATPIDFAYKIHTKVGETTTGAIVNNVIAPLDQELHNNDIVRIITNKNATPSPEWVNIVKATTTRNKIKNFFSKNEKEVYIERGKYTLEKELRKRKFSISEFFNDENVKKICEEFKLDDLEDIYLTVGNGKNSPNSIINCIDKFEEVPAPKVVKVTSKNMDADIIVSGIDKVKVNLANCCCPVYGDDIIGYITKGNGITVHRSHCHNLEMLESRTLEVHWNTNVNKRYLTNLLIYSNSQENHMLELIQTISNMNVSVDGIKTISKTNAFIYEASVYVTGLEQLNKLCRSYRKDDEMRVLVQRSGGASVTVDGKEVGKIDQGLVVFVGFTDSDTVAEVEYLAKKIVNLRIFPDDNGVMNKSILDYGGKILSVSQFTLYADCKKGNRPSYIEAMNNHEAIHFYELFNEELRKYIEVETGEFGADMNVNITNIGPTTIWLER